MAVPRPSRCPDPTALLSKVAAVVHLEDAEALEVMGTEEEVEAVEVTEEVVEAEEEEATATSVVSQVTWRENVPKVVEDTEVEAEEVAAVEEAATPVANLDISPGIVLAVDVETDRFTPIGKAVSLSI